MNRIIILAVFCAVLLLHLALIYAGFYGGDDINFSRYAAELAHEGFSKGIPTDHFQLRWTPIVFTAFFYKLWGVNDFTSGLFSTMCISLCGLIIYKMIRKQNILVYLFTMLLFFFSRAMVFYAHRLLADAPVCLAVLSMYYFYSCCRFKSRGNGVAFALAMLFGIMSKESIVIALPLFAVLLFRDLFKKRNYNFWATAIGLSVLLVFLYLLYFRITTGDFFFRYHLLIRHSYMNICSFDQLPFIYTVRRITYELWLAMLLNGDLLIILPAVAGVIYLKKISATGLKKIDVYAFLVLLLCANFMTISWSSYIPLCHDPRHFIFIIPFAAIVGGPMIVTYARSPRSFIILPILFVVATVLMFIRQDGSTKYLYLLCSAILLAALVFKGKGRLVFFGFMSAIILVFSINYFIDFIKPLYPFHHDQARIINNNFKDKNIHGSLFSDGFTGEISEYLLQFQTGSLRVLPDDSIKNKNDGELYYLLNNNLSRGKIDYLFRANPGRAVVKDSSGKLILYQVNNSLLQEIGKLNGNDTP